MTKDSPITVRAAIASDIKAITAIYGHYVENAMATYEEESPNAEEMQRRWLDVTGNGFPYLVAESDGEILGYGYASTFRVRSGYRYTVEDSIYASPHAIGKGIGKKLLSSLIDSCTELGFRQMIAVIGEPSNEASINLHAKQGFVQAGVLPAVGFKFGRFVDTVLMMRPLGEGANTAPE